MKSSDNTKADKDLVPQAKSPVVVYEGGNGVNLEVKYDGETVWLTQAQMAVLFGRSISAISRHVNCVFSEGELPKEGYLHFLQKTPSDGGRPEAYYALDVVISVGYRVKSFEGTRFRQWATRKLREIMLARFADCRRMDKLETRIDGVEQGLLELATEFRDWTIYPAHKPMGYGAEMERQKRKGE